MISLSLTRQRLWYLRVEFHGKVSNPHLHGPCTCRSQPACQPSHASRNETQAFPRAPKEPLSFIPLGFGRLFPSRDWFTARSHSCRDGAIRRCSTDERTAHGVGFDFESRKVRPIVPLLEAGTESFGRSDELRRQRCERSIAVTWQEGSHDGFLMGSHSWPWSCSSSFRLDVRCQREPHVLVPRKMDESNNPGSCDDLPSSRA